MQTHAYKLGLVSLWVVTGLMLCPLARAADPLAGQVSQTTANPGSLTQSITLTPGAGQFSNDKLGFGRQIAITLYNPNPYAMRFETTQRLGKEYSWVVPANSQKTVSFRYWNPVSDEVKFLVYQDPSSLMITEGKVMQKPEATAIVPVVEQTAVTTQTITPYVEPKEEEKAPEGKSAVRGYW